MIEFTIVRNSPSGYDRDYSYYLNFQFVAYEVGRSVAKAAALGSGRVVSAPHCVSGRVVSAPH